MSGVAAETEAMADRLQQVLRSAPPGRATRIRQFVLGDISPLLELHTAKAMALLETVIADDPADGIALAMYGECCQRQRRYREAESHLERALARIPNLEPAQIALAELYLLRNDVDAARHIVDAQRSCHPAFRKRWIEAAAACDATSGWALRIDETADAAVQADQALTGIVSARNGALGGCPAAIAALVRLRSDAFARAPSMRVALAAGLTLPPCANTTIAVRDARSAYADAIAQLHEQCPQSRIATFEPALQHLSWSNVLLAYQGEDDHWLAMAAGTLRPDLALSATRASGAKPRVGIVSGHWYDCTAGWYFESWIDALSALPIELEVVALGLVDDEFSAMDCGGAI